MTYKIGDVVRLKSGGVPMCVTAYHRDEGTKYIGKGTVSVTWLTMTGEPKSYAFDERLVVNVVEEQMNRIKATTDSMLSVSESVDKGYGINTKGYPMTGDTGAGAALFCAKCGKTFPDDGSRPPPCGRADCSITVAMGR